MRTIDPLDHIRRNPAMYLPGGKPDPSHLAARMSYDALVLGATRTMVVHGGEWWTVAADVDWLDVASASPEELFRAVVPFPEAGVNAVRSEALLGAFVDEIVTWDRNARTLVKGGTDDAPSPQALAGDATWARAVAFRLQPSPVAEPLARVGRKG